MKKYNFFILGAIIAGLIQGIALGTYGAFEDSNIYFEFYNRFGTLGFVEATKSLTLQTGKVEPVIMLLFGIESLATGSELSEYWFLVVNVTLMNVLVAGAMFSLMNEQNKSRSYIFVIAVLALSSYFAFTKFLYVWRSVIAFVFFIMFVREPSRKRMLWAGLSCLAHASFIIFIFIYLLMEAIHRSKKTGLYWIVGIVMAAALPLIEAFQGFFRMFLSNSAALNFSEGGGAHPHALNAWLAIAFSLIIIALVRRGYMSNQKLAPLYFFCLMTVVASFTSFQNYLVMSRVSVPAMLLVSFMPYLIENNNWRFQLARLCVLMSLIPTARLWINMFTGTFRG